MRIYLDMVGCRLNQSELEKIARQLREAGGEIVELPKNADLAIVNTCTVTAAAAADSRKIIRRIARAGCPRIIPTGCLATIDPEQIIKLSSVEAIYPNEKKDAIVHDQFHKKIGQDLPINRLPLPGKLKRTRAFIKVQDGCNNFCTFCVTRIARGKSRSQPIAEIFEDVAYALDGGVKEIVLTGVNLGSWGLDLDQPRSLSSLIKGIIQEFDPVRLRLSSLEPWDVTDDLLDVIAHPIFCAHLHLPLQSGSDATLKRMQRRITTSEYQAVVKKIRSVKDNVAITTDLIVGFPGESDHDHRQSLDFVEKMQFAAGHVFRFSPRPGTPAEKIQPAVPEFIKKERSAQLRAMIENSYSEYLKQCIGEKLHVLWERSDKLAVGYRLKGISGNYLNVHAHSKHNLYNQISTVKIRSRSKNYVSGEIIL